MVLAGSARHQTLLLRLADAFPASAEADPGAAGSEVQIVAQVEGAVLLLARFVEGAQEAGGGGVVVVGPVAPVGADGQVVEHLIEAGLPEQARRDGGDADVGLGQRAAKGGVVEHVGTLVAAGEVERQCQRAETALAAQREALAAAVEIVGWRRRAAAITTQLCLAASTGQAGFLIIGAEGEGDEAVAVAEAQLAAGGVEFVAVVVAVVVGTQALRIEAQAPVFAAGAETAAQVAQVVAANAGRDVAGERRAERRAGDDVDRAAARAAAIKHGTGPAEDLDAFDAVEWDRRQAGADQFVLGDALAVNQDQRVLVAGHAEAAQVERRIRRADEVDAAMHAAELVENFADGGGCAVADFVGGDHLGGDRVFLLGGFETGGGDDDGVEIRRRLQVAGEQRQQQRGCGFEADVHWFSPAGSVPACRCA